jgi:putative ABC transport system ATP-binding protein
MGVHLKSIRLKYGPGAWVIDAEGKIRLPYEIGCITMQTKNQNAISLKDVRKTYRMGEDEVKALDGVSLEVRKGEFVAIMGPSGSGKSTMLNMIGCLDVPSSGSITIDGVEVSKLSDRDLARIRGRKLGFIFQFFNLYPTLTAIENVELPMSIADVGDGDRERRAKELLGVVGLEKRAWHLPSQLSGGQRQRVAIARALANDPEIIIADEPTGNLDSKTGREIMEFLNGLQEREGKTIVMVTHEDDIAKFAEKVVRLRDGKIVRG